MLKVTNLNYTVDGTQILHDVSLEVHPGEFVGILGPNGSGKSTLLKNIYKVLKPQSGAIELQGKNLLAMSNREMAQHLAVVGQEHEGSFDFLVEEVVLMGCQARKRLTEGFDESDRQAAMKALRRVELEHLSQRSYLSLSGGEKQKIAIARALVQEPRLLIFDEPTVGLDPKQIIEIRNLIRGLGKAHTVILSTHILQEVQAVCDRIIIINKGKIVANEKTENISSAVDRARRFNAKICGPQKDVLAMLRAFPGITYAEALAERDGDAYTYMIESDYGVDIRKKLFFDLANRGWALIGLEALGMSLEDIFISVVDHSEDLRQRGGAQRVSRKQKAMEKNTAEKEIGASLVEDAKKQRAEAALHDTEDDD